jgi:hypothetical protein
MLRLLAVPKGVLGLAQNKNPADPAGFSNSDQNRLFRKEAELLLESRNATAAINDCALSACPSWVGLWINIKVHCVASFSIGRACREFCAICHHNGDGVIIGVDICFHSG